MNHNFVAQSNIAQIPILMQYYSILFVCLLFTFSFLNAQENEQVIEMEGKEFTLHKVQPGETLFSISKQYQLSVEAIKQANKLEKNSIDFDRILIIPLDAVVEKSEKSAIQQTSTSFFTHKVESGETLYSIARKYENVSPAQIKVMNDLKSDTLKIGMLLEIPQELALIQKENKANERDEVSSKLDSASIIDKRALFYSDTLAVDEKDTSKSESFFDQFDKKTLMAYRSSFEKIDTTLNAYDVERGMGTWLESFSDDDKSYFFALHNTAEKGSILKVRNLMNNRLVYVKVIGKIPDLDRDRNIIIKISEATAHFLNILDEKFLVEIIQKKEKN